MWGSRISPALIFWKQDPLVLFGCWRVHTPMEGDTENHHHTSVVSSNFMCFMWSIVLRNILYFGSRDPGKGAISTLHELATVATHGILHRFAADSIARGPTATFSLSAGSLVRGLHKRSRLCSNSLRFSCSLVHIWLWVLAIMKIKIII